MEGKRFNLDSAFLPEDLLLEKELNELDKENLKEQENNQESKKES